MSRVLGQVQTRAEPDLQHLAADSGEQPSAEFGHHRLIEKEVAEPGKDPPRVEAHEPHPELSADSSRNDFHQGTLRDALQSPSSRSPRLSETPFRIALAAVVVLSTATAGYHRHQAGKSGEKISRHEEGRLLFFTIRLGGLALFVGTLAFLTNPNSMRWASVPLPETVRWSGAVLGLLSVGLVYSTLSTLGRNLTDTVAVRSDHTLVTTGTYRWVRHPYYVGMLLLVGSAFLLSANWLIGVSGLLVFVLLAIRTPIEERKLIERFGDVYRRYMERTGMFVPRWR